MSPSAKTWTCGTQAPIEAIHKIAGRPVKGNAQDDGWTLPASRHRMWPQKVAASLDFQSLLADTDAAKTAGGDACFFWLVRVAVPFLRRSASTTNPRKSPGALRFPAGMGGPRTT